MKLDFRQPTILYGGTFDPVHNGHLHVAREALKALPQAKQLVFVPAAHSPGKAAAVASPEQRLEWLRLVAEPLGFPVWDAEVGRGNESYTVDTLEAAQRFGARPETLYWLVGADAYRSVPRWKNPGRIRALARLLVVERPGETIVPQDSADGILRVPTHPASSTALRERLARGESAGDWLPPPLDQLLPRHSPYVRN